MDNSIFSDDIFVEELISKKKTALNYLIYVGVVVLALVLILAFWLFVPYFFPVLLVLVLFGAYLALRFQGVEYEYTFTNGDLDIDKIMAKRKRVRVVEINCRQIQVMAPYTAEYESETKGFQVKEVVNTASSKNASGQWFFIYEKEDGGNVFVVMQPSRQMRNAIRKYIHSRMKGAET